MPEPNTRRRLVWQALLALVLALSLMSCCPAPAGAVDIPTGFSAMVAEVDDAGFWTVADDGGRWRVAGAPPVDMGERVYLEGAWIASGALRVDRVTPLTDRRP